MEPTTVEINAPTNLPEVGRVVFEGEPPNLRQLKFRVLADRHTTVGRVLGVVGARPNGELILTLIRVEQLREHNPHEDPQSSTVADVIPFETRYAPEGQSTVDRKSTRLNSSHDQISYAVFCLKKKKTQRMTRNPARTTPSTLSHVP